MSKNRQPVTRDMFYSGAHLGLDAEAQKAYRAGKLQRTYFTGDVFAKNISSDTMGQIALTTVLNNFQKHMLAAKEAAPEEKLQEEFAAINQLNQVINSSAERDREVVVNHLHAIITAPTKDPELSQEQYDAILEWVREINEGEVKVEGDQRIATARRPGDAEDKLSAYQPVSYAIPEVLAGVYSEEQRQAITKELEELTRLNAVATETKKDSEKYNIKATEVLMQFQQDGKTGLLEALKTDRRAGAYFRKAAFIAEIETARMEHRSLNLRERDLSNIDFTDLDFTGVTVIADIEPLSHVTGLEKTKGLTSNLVGSALGRRSLRILDVSIREANDLLDWDLDRDKLAGLACNGVAPDLSALSDLDLKRAAWDFLTNMQFNQLDNSDPFAVAQLVEKPKKAFFDTSRAEIEGALRRSLDARGNIVPLALIYNQNFEQTMELVTSLKSGPLAALETDGIERAKPLLVEPYTVDFAKKEQELLSFKAKAKEQSERLTVERKKLYADELLTHLQEPVAPVTGYKPSEQLAYIIGFAKRENLPLDFTNVDIHGIDFSNLDFTGVNVTISAEQLSTVKGLETSVGLPAETVGTALGIIAVHMLDDAIATTRNFLDSNAKLGNLAELTCNGEAPDVSGLSDDELKEVTWEFLRTNLFNTLDATHRYSHSRASDASHETFNAQSRNEVENILREALAARGNRLSLEAIYYSNATKTTSLKDKLSDNDEDISKAKATEPKLVDPYREQVAQKAEELRAFKEQAKTQTSNLGHNRNSVAIKAFLNNLQSPKDPDLGFSSIVRLRTVLEMAKEHNLNIDFNTVDLSGMDLSGMDLSGLDFTGATFTGATLNGANLEGATITAEQLKEVTDILKATTDVHVVVDLDADLEHAGNQDVPVADGTVISGISGELLTAAKRAKLQDMADEVQKQRDTLSRLTKQPNMPAETIRTIELNIRTMETLATNKFSDAVSAISPIIGAESLKIAIDQNQKALEQLGKIRLGTPEEEQKAVANATSLAHSAQHYSSFALTSQDKEPPQPQEEKPVEVGKEQGKFRRALNWIKEAASTVGHAVGHAFSTLGHAISSKMHKTDKTEKTEFASNHQAKRYADVHEALGQTGLASGKEVKKAKTLARERSPERKQKEETPAVTEGKTAVKRPRHSDSEDKKRESKILRHSVVLEGLNIEEGQEPVTEDRRTKHHLRKEVEKHPEDARKFRQSVDKALEGLPEGSISGGKHVDDPTKPKEKDSGLPNKRPPSIRI